MPLWMALWCLHLWLEHVRCRRTGEAPQEIEIVDGSIVARYPDGRISRRPIGDVRVVRRARVSGGAGWLRDPGTVLLPFLARPSYLPFPGGEYALVQFQNGFPGQVVVSDLYTGYSTFVQALERELQAERATP